MNILTIEPAKHKEGSHRSAAKSRRFSAIKLAHICAGMLWNGEAKDGPVRPVWIAFAGSDTGLRPFVANMRAGRLAVLEDPSERSYSRGKPTRFELMRSAGYSFTARRLALPDGTTSETVVAALDSILGIDPGLITPEGVSFLALPPCWWVEREHAAMLADRQMCAEIDRHLRAMRPHRQAMGIPETIDLSTETMLPIVPIAVYVRSYLDRRTRRPMFMTPAFAVQLYLAGLAAGVFSLASTSRSRYKQQDSSDPWRFARHTWADTFVEKDTATIGLMPGVAALATHTKVDRLLAVEVARYVALTNGKEAARIAA